MYLNIYDYVNILMLYVYFNLWNSEDLLDC